MSVTFGSNVKTFTLQVGIYDNDSETFTGVSELQNYIYDQTCTAQDIHLTWLNSLGCWEYWNFQGENTIGIDITESVSAVKNSFEDWDVDFRTLETEEFYHTVKAYNTKIVRSQLMNAATAQAVAPIRYSIQAQEINDDQTKLTVLIDKGSFEIYKQGDKQIEMNFNLRNSEAIPIQNQ